LKPFVTPSGWSKAASRLIKAEVARAGITLASLAEKLRELGVDETEASIKGKLHRGTFSAAFLLQCMTVLGRERIDISAVAPRDKEPN